MNQSSRNYLKKDDKIMLSSAPDGSSPDVYEIREKVGEGASAVCYDAVKKAKDGSLQSGKLKEFYPLDCSSNPSVCLYSLTRREEDHQLVPQPGSIRTFSEACHAYIAPYRAMNEKTAENPENEILKNYIQFGEILYGTACAENTASPQNASEGILPAVYIWSPGKKGITYSEFLSQLTEDPAAAPEKSIEQILHIAISLTDCVKALNTAGFYNLDIKPSNLMILQDSDGNILPYDVSLFDMDALCCGTDTPGPLSGSPGFSAPELLRNKKTDYRADFYAIGALLYYSLNLSENVANRCYQDKDYEQMDQLIRQSAFFSASEILSEDVFISKISRILKKCLARYPSRRYQDSESLLADLRKALARLEQIVSEATYAAPVPGTADSTIVIQKLLYEHPLYESLPPDAEELNVLVVGSGIYAQKFTDITLQSAQMSDISLHISWVYENPAEAKEAYLQYRPGLADFIRIDDEWDDPNPRHRPYAGLSFRPIYAADEEPDTETWFTNLLKADQNRLLAEKIWSDTYLEEREYHYVFVAVGDDAVNRRIAGYFSENFAQLNSTIPVCYIRRGGKTNPDSVHRRIYPVYIQETADLNSVHSALDEMAFNAHLSWRDSLNLDLDEERRRFYDNTYNYRSSMALVLSVKYKLYSVGIPLSAAPDETELINAAQHFSEEILKNPDAKEKLDRTIELEHRRWVLEKVTEGWTAPRNADGSLSLNMCAINSNVKDSQNRTHPCIVYSSASSPLNDYSLSDWDINEIDRELDDLDRMSVELHRVMKHYADDPDERTRIQDALIRIEQLIPPENKAAVSAAGEFCHTIRNLLHGFRHDIRKFDDRKQNLLKAIRSIPEENEAQIRKILPTFFCLEESMRYRNYKENDSRLIRRIPFILTFRHPTRIAMVFEDAKMQNGRNEAVFSNVASATVLSPSELHYLYYFDRSSDENFLLRKFDSVLNYLDRRNVYCNVFLAIACSADVEDSVVCALQEKLNDRGNHSDSAAYAVLAGYNLTQEPESAEEATLYFADYLKAHSVDLFDASNLPFSSGFDNAVFLDVLCGGNASGVPDPDTAPVKGSFEFDPPRKIFTPRFGCDFLKFVQDQSFLHITDMFALMNVTDEHYETPGFADDYEELWKIYSGNAERYCRRNPEKIYAYSVKNWNHLCDALAKIDEPESANRLAYFPLEERNTRRETTQLTWRLPAYVYKTADSLMDQLKEHEVIASSSRLQWSGGDACTITIDFMDSVRYRTALRSIFTDADPEIFRPEYGLTTRINRRNPERLDVIYNNLTVRADLEDYAAYEYGADHMANVLELLNQKGFIHGLERSDSAVSFTYANHRYKTLLTKAGQILELYTYYEIMKTDYFDDIVTGYEFTWEDGTVTNELDLILTKGFRSIIIECKAERKLDQDFYFKLQGIADLFGIGTTKVLIGNTYDRSNIIINDQNAIQRRRGSLLNIRTISSEENIKNIGDSIIRIMEEG